VIGFEAPGICVGGEGAGDFGPLPPAAREFAGIGAFETGKPDPFDAIGDDLPADIVGSVEKTEADVFLDGETAEVGVFLQAGVSLNGG